MNISAINNPAPMGTATQPLQDAGAVVRQTQLRAQTAAPVTENAVQGVEQSKAIDPEAVKAAVAEVQEFVSQMTQNLEFSIDDDTGRTVVKVIDRQTDEILRQIPSEEMLQIAKALGKLSGLLVQQKA